MDNNSGDTEYQIVVRNSDSSYTNVDNPTAAPSNVKNVQAEVISSELAAATCGAGFCFVSAENKTCLPIEGGKLGGRSITPKGMCVTCGATTMPVLSDGKWTCDKGCISTMAHMRSCFARNDFRKCVMEKSGCGADTNNATASGGETPAGPLQCVACYTSCVSGAAPIPNGKCPAGSGDCM